VTGRERARNLYRLVRSRLRSYRDTSLWGDLGLLAPAVRRMAETGAGTDECLDLGCLPMLVHYYSPVPDLADLRARRVWDRRSPMAGIDMRESQQLALLAELGREFGDECCWPHEPSREVSEFYTDNSSFSYGCAAATHALVRKLRPLRVIEVGSGFSSRVIAAAVQRNEKDGGERAAYTVVDPFPASTLDRLAGVGRVLQQRVELLDVDMFRSLGENDILFVDSGHTVRAGGDVNFLVLDVLPVLAPGVVVHFHDIPLPYEYAETYFTNPRFRMLWTEAYLLQAFLCHNTTYEILLAMNFLMQDHTAAFRAAWPHYDAAIHRFPSHSFWIRRVR
jgi:methyltransferase family protein